jgi:hypothetical protein
MGTTIFIMMLRLFAEKATRIPKPAIKASKDSLEKVKGKTISEIAIRIQTTDLTARLLEEQRIYTHSITWRAIYPARVLELKFQKPDNRRVLCPR